MALAPTVTLHSGREMPAIGLGTWPLPPAILAMLDGLDLHDEGERGIRDSATHEG